MSYDIDLIDPTTGESCEVGRHKEGGMYAVGGTVRSRLNVTSNYRSFYYAELCPDRGIRSLYGRTARECIPTMERAVAKLGTMRDNDYWASTPGNAGYALSILLGWARLHPDGVFRGD